MAANNLVQVLRRPFSTGLCFLCALCEGFDVQAAGVAATGITRALHCTPADLGLFFLASGVGLLIGARVVRELDRTSRIRDQWPACRVRVRAVRLRGGRQ